jgi:DNA-binding IclR family transcriptional regulator
MKDSTIYNVRVIERAMQVLDCFDDDHPEIGISEIAQRTSLSPATALRLLVTLQGGGYVERAAGSDKFRLGPRLMEMGMGVVRRLRARREARPVMVALEERFQETCDLSVFVQNALLCVDVVQSRRALRIAGGPGYRSPLHCTASGKVFLANLPPEDADAMLGAPLERHTAKTITSPERLREQIAEIRARGYGTDDEEFGQGVRAVAAPIRNPDARVIAVLGMVGPVERMDAERQREIGLALVEAADAISARLA